LKVWNLNGEWSLACYDYREIMPQTADFGEPKMTLAATVPGDVHADLQKAGLLDAVFYSDNYLKAAWVPESDWCYIREFTVDRLEARTELVFEGLDLYAVIYLNGQKVGETENALIPHHVNVDGVIREGVNTLAVYFRSVRKISAAFPKQNYGGCFDTARLFMRKAQCQFSWDWAPALPAVGIWQDVKMVTRAGHRILSHRFDTRLDGRVTLFFEIDGEGAKWSGDEQEFERKLISVDVPQAQRTYTVKLTVQNGDQTIEVEREFQDYREFFTFTVEDPQLWWPHDMGEQPLYPYTFAYYEDGVLSDEVSGRFAIRTVELNEEPRDDGEDGLKCELLVNGERTFLKGGNWVPMDCFPGTVEDARYRRILEEAKLANVNAFRIWGGGIYEKDVFYDICDELGILIWQDLAFACAEVPVDHPGFLDLITVEIDTVVRRLANHPCIALWCGGNERNGCFGYFPCLGEELFLYTMRGIVNGLDPSRPYVDGSPYGYNHMGGRVRSGDHHTSAFNIGSTLDWNERRELFKTTVSGMATEVGCMGFPPMSSLKKYIPAEEMTHDSRVIDLHFVRNPHDGEGKGFLEKEYELANDMFGPCADFNDFAKKSACVQSEFVTLDTTFHRSRKGNCAASLLWMYNDCWPCGTWSVVDYYLEPKAAYYALKRACEPVAAVIAKRPDGLGAYAVNDTRADVVGTLTVGQMDTDGTVVFREVREVTAPALSSVKVYDFSAVDTTRPNSFVFVRFTSGDIATQQVWFFQNWKDITWEQPRLTVTAEQKDKHHITVTLTAEKYTRFVRLQGLGDGVWYSDNYFDLLPEQKKTVVITAEKAISMDDITVDHWLTDWKD